MNPVLIIKNCTREGPGIIETILRQESIPFQIVDLDQGERFPSLKDYAALIILGGPDSANDNTPKIKTDLERLEEGLSLKLPCFGVCLGLQLLVKAAGGHVMKNPVQEIGFRDEAGNLFEVNLTDHGQNDPLCRGMKSPFKIFQLHGETVRLTGQMTLLGTGAWCTHQLVRVQPKAYGIQGHLELTRGLFESWSHNDPDLLKLNATELKTDYESLQKELKKTGETMVINFLNLAGFSAG